MPAKTAVPATEVETVAPRRLVPRILAMLGMVLGGAGLAAAGFGAGWYLYSGTQSPVSNALRLIERGETTAMAAPASGKTRRPLPDSGAFVTTYYTFAEPLTTNPAGSRRFLQVGVTLSTQYDARVMTHVETHKAAIRSDMLAVLGSFSEDQIVGREGREALATALRDVINERLGALEGFGGVEGVYFPSFVLQ